MSCLLAFASVCLLDPSTAYVSTELDFGNSHSTHVVAGETFEEGSWCRTSYCVGPLATVRAGWTVEVSESLTLDVGYMHRSFLLDRRDRGYEAPYLRATWRPWRGK